MYGFPLRSEITHSVHSRTSSHWEDRAWLSLFIPDLRELSRISLEGLTMHLSPWKIFFTTAFVLLEIHCVSGFNDFTDSNAISSKENATDVRVDREFEFCKYGNSVYDVHEPNASIWLMCSLWVQTSISYLNVFVVLYQACRIRHWLKQIEWLVIAKQHWLCYLSLKAAPDNLWTLQIERNCPNTITKLGDWIRFVCGVNSVSCL